MTLNNELCVMGTGKDIKSFIETLLAEQKQAFIEAIKNHNTKTHACRFNDGVQNCDCYLEACRKAVDIIKSL